MATLELESDSPKIIVSPITRVGEAVFWLLQKAVGQWHFSQNNFITNNGFVKSRNTSSPSCVFDPATKKQCWKPRSSARPMAFLDMTSSACAGHRWIVVSSSCNFRSDSPPKPRRSDRPGLGSFVCKASPPRLLGRFPIIRCMTMKMMKWQG